MYIEIEDDGLFQQVADELHGSSENLWVVDDRMMPDNYVPGTGMTVVSHIGPIDETDPFYRWEELHLASLGVRSWRKSFSFGPTYAGSDPKEIRDIIVDAKFAEGKAAYVAGFGVNYLGRVNLDPRTLVLVDYKGDPLHLPDRDGTISDLIVSLPEDTYTTKTEASWTSFGIASASNVEKLRGFLEYYDQTNVLAYSEGAKAKLRYLGRDFAEVDTPRADVKYGQSLRAESSLMRPYK